jgi:aspartate/methionine/tyrosine aminotransferase
MGFEKNDYLHWYIPRIFSGEDPINLHASGMPSLKPEEIEMAEGDPWTMTENFEQMLAAWLGIDAGEVCFTPGATGGTLLALLTLADQGAEVLVEAPAYEPVWRQAERINKVHRFTRTLEEGWRLPLEEIEHKLSDRTALVLVTEPANPSGTFCAREDVMALAAAAASRGAHLIINEAYRRFTHAPSFHGEGENIVVVSSLSKLLGTYWIRLGWLSGKTETIQRLRSGHMNLGMATQPAAAYGIGVLDKADEIRTRAMEISQTGAETVDAWVRATKGLEWIKPMGIGFGCVKLPDPWKNDIAFVEKLNEQEGVLAVPGRFFGVPGTVRISWLQSGDRLEEGLERFGKVLRAR